MLIQDENIDLNAKTKDDYTPLGLASRYNNNKILSILISNPKVDVNSIVEKQIIYSQQNSFLYETLLFILLSKNNDKILDQLIDQRPELNIVDENGLSSIKIPNFYSSTRADYSIEEFLKTYSKGVQTYLFNLSSEDENINRKKNKIVSENKVFFACLAARYCDENVLQKILDDYEVDINSIEEKTILKNF